MLVYCKKRRDTQSDTPWVNIQDATQCRQSFQSYSNQSTGYYKESSGWWLPDHKEHKEEQELRRNWLRVWTHKVIHPESISKMLHSVGNLSNHIATSQLDTTKSQVAGDYLIIKNTKKNKNYVEIGSECATFYISCTRSQYFWFFFLNSDTDLLDLTILGNPFQIKDPRKCTELVP